KLDATHLAERDFEELSSGETRRLLIARALVHDPRALILDEPSTSLDLFAQHELRERLRHLAQAGTGIVIITHHLTDLIPETDQGLTGIGEGGAHDTMEQCAGMLIGEDPFRTDYLWQMLYRGYFYPAGREKVHALGALDLALWDLKGKALGVPVYQLLGGRSRDHVECYSTGYPARGSPKEVAKACVDGGFRAYRSSTDTRGPVVDRFDNVKRVYELCKQVREGVGKDGSWCIDFHTELDMPDAVALANLIEP